MGTTTITTTHRGRWILGRHRRSAALGAGALALVAGLLGTAAPAASAAPPVAPPRGAVVAGAPGPACPRPIYPSPAAAAAGAPAGATIYVCAGVYRDTVTVSKTQTFLGAQAGRDARTGRTTASAESVIESPTGGFVVGGGVVGVTIDGFTIQGPRTGTAANAINAFAGGGSGLRVLDNVVRDNANGMNINSTGAQPSLIARNRFTDNVRGGGPQNGTGIFLSSGPTNATTIEDNLFERHSETAINTAGDDARRSTGLVIRGNRSVDDATFLVDTNTSGLVVERNLVTHRPGASGTAVLLFGNTDGTRVRDNLVDGGASTGISVAQFTAAPNTAVVVERNVVRARATGIRVSGAHRSVLISRNQVVGSTGNPAADVPGVGIRLDATTATLRVEENVATGSRSVDCRDDSKGTGTVGTANTWVRDVGATATPRGLCLPGR